jgi:DNA-binding MarR family transcriptional regulator
MSRDQIFDTLSHQLQAHGISQTQLSEHLQLTGTAVKQIFESKDCTFSCMEKMCELAGLKLEELLHKTPKQTQLLEKLTQQQEIEFLSNKKLFAVAIGVMYFWNFKDLLGRVKVNKVELTQLLQRLEEIGFLKMVSASQFKSMLAPRFGWIPDGPIMRMVRRESLEFLSHNFDGEGDVLHAMNIFVTPETREKLRHQLNSIAQEYKKHMVMEANLPADDKRMVSLIIAARPWLPGFLQNQMR